MIGNPNEGLYRVPNIMFVVFCSFMGCLLPAGVNAQNPSGMIVPGEKTIKDTTGQRDLIEIVVKATHIHFKNPSKTNGRAVYYSLLPLSTSVPGGGNALITSTTASFYLGDRTNTYQSNVTFSPGFNFHGAFNFPFRSNIWSPGNSWNYQGDMRFSIFPRYTWGLGGGQDYKDKLLIRYEYVRFYQNALKRITPYLLAGFGYNLDWNISVHADDSIQLDKFSGYPYGTANRANSFSSGVTFNLLYDTRNNSLNPLPGSFLNAIYRVNPTFLGSSFYWNSLYLDARKYFSIRPKGQNVLALWSYFWTTLGSNPPYLNLPAVGGDTYQRSGRGFYSGRYTGKSLLYMESEYRRDITNDGLFGFVVFAELVSATEPNNKQFAYWHPAAGGGLRIKFNKRSGTNIALDYGFSKGYGALNISLGEAF